MYSQFPFCYVEVNSYIAYCLNFQNRVDIGHVLLKGLQLSNKVKLDLAPRTDRPLWPEVVAEAVIGGLLLPLTVIIEEALCEIGGKLKLTGVG